MAFSLSGTTITQTGTNTNVPASSGNGFIISTGVDGIRNADISGRTLNVNGTMTVPFTTFLRGTTTIINVLAGGTLIFDGTQTVGGVDIATMALLLNIEGNGGSPNGILRLQSTDPNNPSKVIFKNCKSITVARGSAWAAISDRTNNPNNEIRTEGEAVYLQSNPNLTGTGKDRLRIDGANTKSLNFQAEKTYTDLWMNIGANQKSTKGYTPYNVDGPEINAGALSIAERVDMPDYDSRAVIGSYYSNAQIVIWGGHYARFIGSKLCTNQRTTFASGTGVVEFTKPLRFECIDGNDAPISDIVAAHSYTAAYPSGYRAKGMTSDIQGHSAGVEYLTHANAIEVEVMVAALRANVTATNNYNYFVSEATKGAEKQNFMVGSYGYAKISIAVELHDTGILLEKSKLVKLPTVLTKAQATALTGIAVNHTTKTVAVTENRTTSQIYDWLQQELYTQASILTADTFSLTGDTLNIGAYSVNGANFITGGVIAANQNGFLKERNGAQFTIYATEANRNARTNPLASNVGRYNFLFSSLPANPIYLWVKSGSTELPAQTTLTIGENTIDLGVGGALNTLSNLIRYIPAKIYFDPSATVNGTGTEVRPFNTLAEAISFSNTVGSKTIVILGDYTLSQQLTGLSVEGGASKSKLALNGKKLENVSFSGIELTGAASSTSQWDAYMCTLNGTSGMRGNYINCYLKGVLKIADNAEAHFLNVSSFVPGNGRPTIDLAGKSNVLMDVRNYKGGLTLAGSSSAGNQVTISGTENKIRLSSTNTMGTISVRGISQFEDNSAGASVDISALLIPKVLDDARLAARRAYQNS